MRYPDRNFKCENKQCELYNQTQGDAGVEEVKKPKCSCGKILGEVKA